MALVGLLILHGFTGVASCIQILYTSQLSPHNHTSISMDILSPVGNEGKKHRQIPLSASFCCATTMYHPYRMELLGGSRAALELEKLEKEIPNEKVHHSITLFPSCITRKPRT